MRLAASRPSGRLANATAESPERDSTLGLCRIIIGLRTERPIRMVDKLGEPPLAPWRELTLGGYLRAHRSGLRWGGQHPGRPAVSLHKQKEADTEAGVSREACYRISVGGRFSGSDRDGPRQLRQC